MMHRIYFQCLRNVGVLGKLLCQKRAFHFSTHLYGLKYRMEKGLPTNPSSYGPLTNLADYSYVDDRPVPVSANMRKRLILQIKYAEKIINLSEELDFATERHQRLKREKESFRREIISGKLAQKGKHFLCEG